MGASFTDTDKQTFLDALSRSGVIAQAMGAAGVKSRQTVKRWCEEDEQFREAYDDAMADAADTLEVEARRRATDGVIRTKVIGSGENARVIDEVQYSDQLLLALLKAKKPHEFAERSKTEITSPDNAFKPENETQTAARIAAILDAARQRMLAASPSQLEAQDPLFE